MTRVLAAALVLGHLLAAPMAQEASRPHVLFVIADDLGAQALSCYGCSNVNTPAIDGLAASGTRFTRAYCQFPVCGPARASLLSGMHARSVGVMGNGQANNLARKLGDRPTLPQWFRQHGWHTARAGKLFHMRVPGDITAGVHGPDHEPSWVERYSFRAPEWQSEGTATHLSNETLRFDRDRHYNLGFGTAFYVVETEDDAEQHDKLATDKAIDLMRRHADGDEPLFLAVGLVRPHVPLVAPRAWFPAADAMHTPPVPAGDLDDIPRLGISRTSESFGLDAAGKRAVWRAYAAAVAFMDAQVGRLLAALDEQGLAANTIVVFTSDHGYHLGEHDLWQKLSLHEESARVPLILRVPGHDPAEVAGLVQHIDLFPTLAALCGLDHPPHCEGRSLLPLLRDPSARVHDAVGCVNGRGELVRTERWALLAWQDGTRELYDMRDDPQQHVNLAQRPEYRAVVTELEQLAGSPR